MQLRLTGGVEGTLVEVAPTIPWEELETAVLPLPLLPADEELLLLVYNPVFSEPQKIMFMPAWLNVILCVRIVDY